jgi:hypothetical protein
MAQIFQGLLCEETSTLFDEKLIVCNNLQHRGQMSYMIFQRRAIDWNIIHKDKHIFSQQVIENGIHNVLKCSWRVCEPKRHHTKLIQDLVSVKGCLELLSFSHPNLMIPGAQINFCKPPWKQSTRPTIPPQQAVGPCFLQ